MKNLQSDYFFYRIPQSLQTKPMYILGLLGVLHARSQNYTLHLSKCKMHDPKKRVFENVQTVKMKALICDKDDNPVKSIKADGSLSQCYEYICGCFELFLAEHNDEIFCEKYDELSYSDLFPQPQD